MRRVRSRHWPLNLSSFPPPIDGLFQKGGWDLSPLYTENLLVHGVISHVLSQARVKLQGIVMQDILANLAGILFRKVTPIWSFHEHFGQTATGQFQFAIDPFRS